MSHLAVSFTLLLACQFDILKIAVETPPLSAGSGYSSSPGLSPFPQSPIAPHHPPSPDRHNLKVTTLPTREVPQNNTQPIPIDGPTSHISLPMPLSDKPRNQPPDMAITNSIDSLPSLPSPTNIMFSVETPSTAKHIPPPRPPTRGSESGSSASSYSRGLLIRSDSTSTSSSRREARVEVPRSSTPMSQSDSDLGGLAYADSTDYEDEAGSGDIKTSKGKAKPPPPLPSMSSILRSDTTTSTNHIRFPSDSDRSGRSGIRILPSNTGNRRDASVSSVSSSSSHPRDQNPRKSNAAAVAHALGLSQRPPSDYIKLGGPGVGMGGRIGRSGSVSSSGSKSALPRGRTESAATSSGKMEREMATLLEDATASTSTTAEEPHRVGLSENKSAGKETMFVSNGSASESDDGTRLFGAHRSNTVQGIPLSEPRSPKLPTRARTSAEKSVDGKKERTKKERICLKCRTKIDNGRWIRVDSESGGVLCESCWKNMYLPKVSYS